MPQPPYSVDMAPDDFFLFKKKKKKKIKTPFKGQRFTAIEKIKEKTGAIGDTKRSVSRLKCIICKGGYFV